MTKLVIVESPAKARTIGNYVGSDFVVEASIGHIRRTSALIGACRNEEGLFLASSPWISTTISIRITW